MFTLLQKRIIGHAFLILIVALCAGLGLTASLLGGIEVVPGRISEFTIPGTSAAWARTHVGGILNALMVLGVALVLPGLGFADAKARRLGWMVIGTGWANTVFYWGAIFAPNRALSFADNRWGPANIASVIGLLPALVFAVVMLYVATAIAWQALRKS